MKLKNWFIPDRNSLDKRLDTTLAEMTLGKDFTEELIEGGVKIEDIIHWARNSVDRVHEKLSNSKNSSESLKYEFGIGLIFLNAENSVNILAHDLTKNTNRSKFYIESIKAFLNRGGQLKIILKEKSHVESEILSLLSTWKEEDENLDITVYRLEQDIPEEILEKIELDFIVADSSLTRLEKDNTNKKAEVNFGDVNLARKLNQIFEDLITKEYCTEFTEFYGKKAS